MGQAGRLVLLLAGAADAGWNMTDDNTCEAVYALWLLLLRSW
jgi:hypothetical protein